MISEYRVRFKKNLNKLPKYEFIDISFIFSKSSIDIWDVNYQITDLNSHEILIFKNFLIKLFKEFEYKTSNFVFLMTGESFSKGFRYTIAYNIIKQIILEHNIKNFLFVDNNIGQSNIINHRGYPFIIGRNSPWVNSFFYNKKFIKNFICLNGNDFPHRSEIFNFINSDTDLKNKTFLSYEPNNKNHPFHTIIDLDKINGQDPYFRYVNINPLCDNSFCNIITESFFDNPPIHITEKTDRAFAHRQPFIMVGGCRYLTKLKGLGFKTFDKWWDESYDLEFDNIKRMNKIKKVITEISKWDLNKCQEVYLEMEDVLQNNYNVSNDMWQSFGKNYVNFDDYLIKYDSKNNKILDNSL